MPFRPDYALEIPVLGVLSEGYTLFSDTTLGLSLAEALIAAGILHAEDEWDGDLESTLRSGLSCWLNDTLGASRWEFFNCSMLLVDSLEERYNLPEEWLTRHYPDLADLSYQERPELACVTLSTEAVECAWCEPVCTFLDSVAPFAGQQAYLVVCDALNYIVQGITPSLIDSFLEYDYLEEMELGMSLPQYKALPRHQRVAIPEDLQEDIPELAREGEFSITHIEYALTQDLTPMQAQLCRDVILLYRHVQAGKQWERETGFSLDHLVDGTDEGMIQLPPVLCGWQRGDTIQRVWDDQAEQRNQGYPSEFWTMTFRYDRPDLFQKGLWALTWTMLGIGLIDCCLQGLTEDRHRDHRFS